MTKVSLCLFQVFHFKQMLKKGGKEGIKEMKLKNADLKPFVASVQKALVHLPEVLKVHFRFFISGCKA